MPQTPKQHKYYTYVAGLNTEAGPYTFPPNAWKDGINVIPDIDGSIRRRVRLDFEAGNVESDVTTDFTEERLGAFLSEIWHNVAGVGGKTFVVAQRGRIIRFYDNNADPVSTTEFDFQIDLTDYQVPGNPHTIGTNPIQIASANGKLIVTSLDTEPFIVTYSIEDDDISVETITLKIRDFEGEDDGLDVNERITNSSPNATIYKHEYNLLNQGWINEYGTSPADITGYIGTYLAVTGYWPTNAQIRVAGKNSTDDFDPALLDKQYFGSTHAPRGHYILDLFNRDRAASTGVFATTFAAYLDPAEVELTRPRACCFFAGRAWYAGINSLKVANWVMFSQVAEDDKLYGLCYQDADPTSEFISDLVATDGGVIVIHDAGNIIKLWQIGSSMVVFADNGVWEIYGTANGFSADGYTVTKVSNFGITSPKSVVEVNNSLMFWSDNGVYLLSTAAGAHQSLTGGNISIEPMTDLSIATLYTAIPPNSKLYSSGLFDEEAKVVYWGYSSTDRGTLEYRYRKDYLLCFDVRLKAWYVLGIAALVTMSPYFTDLFLTGGQGPSTSEVVVLDDDGDPVTIGGDAELSEHKFPGEQLYQELLYNSTEDKIVMWWQQNSASDPFLSLIDPDTDTVSSTIVISEVQNVYSPIIYNATKDAYFYRANVGGGAGTPYIIKLNPDGSFAFRVNAAYLTPTENPFDHEVWVQTESGGGIARNLKKLSALGAAATTQATTYYPNWFDFDPATGDIYYTTAEVSGVSDHQLYKISGGVETVVITAHSTQLTTMVYDSSRSSFWIAQNSGTWVEYHIGSGLTGNTVSFPDGIAHAGNPRTYVIDANCDALWGTAYQFGSERIFAVSLSDGSTLVDFTTAADGLYAPGQMAVAGTRTRPYILDINTDDFYAKYWRVGDGTSCGLAELVTATLATTEGRHKTLKFFTTVPGNTESNVTLSDMQNQYNAPQKFRDWYGSDLAGASFDAYLVTGYEIEQEGANRMDALYITVTHNRTETGTDSGNEPINPSSCLLAARWDWTDNTITGKWSVPYQTYKHLRPYTTLPSQSTWDDGYPVVVTKNKVRGRGRSIYLKFQSDPDKDMWLVGWAATYLVNNNV